MTKKEFILLLAELIVFVSEKPHSSHWTNFSKGYLKGLLSRLQEPKK